MAIFYATISSNQTFNGVSGPGHVEIHAIDEGYARKLIREATDNKWAFMYKDINEVHELDRILLGVLW